MQDQVGVRRVEIQFLTLNLGIACLVLVTLTSIGNLLQLAVLKRLSIFVFVGSYILTAWAIALHRVFDARQVFLSLGQRLGLVVGLGAGILGLRRLVEGIFPPPADLYLSIAICSTVAFWLDRVSRQWLDLDGDKVIREMRRAVIEIARSDASPDQLVVGFQALLRERCRTHLATLLFDQEVRSATTLDFSRDRPAYAALCEHGWATPESLERRRTSPALADLRAFLLEHSLGVMVAAPRGSPNPSLIVALGPKNNRWPHTYPEVQRLQNIAELMDNFLIHSRLTTQAALKAKIDHLALLSRGLAHDLKNLITPISSFLVHTEDQFPPGSAAQEVHADAKRSVKLMTDYVGEALFFANRLTPRFDPVRLPDVFKAVRESTASHLARRGIVLSIAVAPDCSLTADAVLLQRLLANLVANAADASTPGQTVTLAAESVRPGWVRLQVTDQGSGISRENLSRIFDPYFTTKEFGNDTRGFGLGLTICQKIVQLHRGAVSVQSEPGQGTTIQIDLPLAQADLRPETPPPV